MVSAHAGGPGGFGGEGEQHSSRGSSGARCGIRSSSAALEARAATAASERPRLAGPPHAEGSGSPGDPHGARAAPGVPLHPLGPSVCGCFPALRGMRAAHICVGLLHCSLLVSPASCRSCVCPLVWLLLGLLTSSSAGPNQPPACAAEKLLIQQVLIVWVSFPLCSSKTGPESCCSLHMCARRRVFRQGQQKSRELSWGDTLLPSGETHLFPLQHKARGCTSLRTLISFTSPTMFMGPFCNSGVTCRCVMLGPQLYFWGWLQSARAVVPTAEPRTCP